MNDIRNPIFIVHKLPSGKAECIIFAGALGNLGDDHKIMGLYIADLIGHVAKATGVSVSAVTDWVNKELKSPTTNLIQTNTN